MVSSADLVISIAGKTGSPESIMLAQALDIPALPLLFTGGASAGLTEAAREFGLDDETIRRWSAAGRAPEAELESYAQEVIDLVLARAVLPCFVAMPYGDETIEDIYTHAIEPGAALAGFRTVRSDQEVRPGQIPGQMLAAIADAAVVIAVLTDDRFPRLGADGLPVHEGAGVNPNVMFETGYARALGRPTVQLARAATDLPFDVRVDRTIAYGLLDHRHLRESINQVLRPLRAGARNALVQRPRE